MNIFDTISPQHGETFRTLLEHKNIKINHIISSSDVEKIEYIQDEDEFLSFGFLCHFDMHVNDF